MKIVRQKFDRFSQAGKVDFARVDATTEQQIAEHAIEDDRQPLQDAARFAAVFECV